jgi:hypothetical protein
MYTFFMTFTTPKSELQMGVKSFNKAYFSAIILLNPMTQRNTQPNPGFALIGLLLVVVIIAIMALAYYGKSNDGKASRAEVGKKAIEDTKANNQTQLEQQIEIQNQLNSIE